MYLSTSYAVRSIPRNFHCPNPLVPIAREPAPQSNRAGIRLFENRNRNENHGNNGVSLVRLRILSTRVIRPIDASRVVRELPRSDFSFHFTLFFCFILSVYLSSSVESFQPRIQNISMNLKFDHVRRSDIWSVHGA